MGKGGTYVGLDALINGLEAALEAGLDQVAEKAAEQARRHAKGRLASEVEVVAPLKGIRVVQPTKAAYYGKWMENGRAGFVPKGGSRRGGRSAAKVIMFFVNGRQIFTKRVGPEKPNPYMAYATAYLKAAGARDLQAAIDRVAAQ